MQQDQRGLNTRTGSWGLIKPHAGSLIPGVTWLGLEIDSNTSKRSLSAAPSPYMSDLQRSATINSSIAAIKGSIAAANRSSRTVVHEADWLVLCWGLHVLLTLRSEAQYQTPPSSVG
eukprot:3842719-Rhodomonas_salina.1